MKIILENKQVYTTKEVQHKTIIVAYDEEEDAIIYVQEVDDGYSDIVVTDSCDSVYLSLKEATDLAKGLNMMVKELKKK